MNDPSSNGALEPGSSAVTARAVEADQDSTTRYLFLCHRLALDFGIEAAENALDRLQSCNTPPVEEEPLLEPVR